jgi:drug/metabolite transporter (DMT)-like permease
MAFAGAALVGAESILALTPVAIKQTPLDPISAIWSRVGSSSVLGWLLAGDRSLPRSEWAGAAALGHVNLLHIASSYEAFRNLPAGQAMSLLYTYPLWNLVFGALFGGEKIAGREFGMITLAAVGSLLLNQDPGPVAESGLGRKPRAGWGIAMGLLMALTESAMHTILRGLDWKDAAKSVWVVNGSAAGWLGGFLGLDWLLDMAGISTDTGVGHLPKSEAKKKEGGKATWFDAIWLTAFHSISMFSGYWLRFYAVPRLSVVTYSILSYAGLLASYLFGLVFLGERPGWISLLGMALILVSGLILQFSAPSAETPTPTEKKEPMP